MIDIHCHIIPGVDDGSPDMRTSLSMAAIAAGDGIKTLVATPHIQSEIMGPDVIREKVMMLNERFSEAGIPVSVAAGGEVASFLPVSTIRKYSINDNGYILLEFPHSHLPYTAKETVANIMSEGLRVIIAHPERNPSVIRSPEILVDIVESTGAGIQITANSICGEFGHAIKSCARHLLKKKIVTVIASDAHSAGLRKPVLAEGVKAAGKIVGLEAAEKMVRDNPRSILFGLPVL
jgi:protein-tyrosine phosphatase